MGGFSNIVGRTMNRLGCDLDAVIDAFKRLDNLSPGRLNTIFNVDTNHQIQNSDDIFALKVTSKIIMLIKHSLAELYS